MFLLSADIIFAELSIASSLIAFSLKLIFRNVFYIKLSGQNKSKLAKSLKLIGILPLPIADLEKISSFADADSDPNGYAWSWIDQKLGKIDFGVLESIFPNIKKLDQKIRLYLLDFVALKLTSTGSKLIFWNENYPQKKIIFISFSWEDYAIPKFPDNCFKIILPLPNFTSAFSYPFLMLSKSIVRLKKIFSYKKNSNLKNSEIKSKFHWENYHHSYVTHAGLSYGSLYNKNLYYSDTYTFFDSKNLVHFDYSGINSPSEDLPWWKLTPAKSLNFSDIVSTVFKFIQSFQNRKLKGISIIISTRLLILFLKYQAHLKDLGNFKNLKMAYIDYDMLCPKSLLMAFESLGIKTIATQERFVFSFYNTNAVFLNYYFVPSFLSKESMDLSKSFLIENYEIVGQYRTDHFFRDFEYKDLQRKNIRKKILVLGHHCWTEWYDNEIDPILSWKSQLHFLNDIHSLATIHEDCLFVLRYKEIDWLKIDFFSKVKSDITKLKNVIISEDYYISFLSYKLVQDVDFIIGKQTSLMDEALSIGKPVLMHDFTHNVLSIFGDTFDYEGSRILCKSSDEFKERVGLLIEDDVDLKREILDVSKKLYGNYSNGSVKSQIQETIKNKIFSIRN